MDWQRVLVAALILGTGVKCHGPVFLLEPPTHLTFSNTTGSQVSCAAHGSPTPQVDWLLQDGHTVTSVPGLRQSLGNGTLYFPPFRAEDYRKDVHSTIYRCRASNIVGTILSREVNVQAVVNQPYQVQVYNTHVTIGNTAVLECVIPAFVKEHVTVTSWSRDETILLPGSNMGGRLIVISGTGDLHIRSARPEDGLSRYSCLTMHTLTQERKRSAPALLTVTEAKRDVAPRLATSIQTVLSADRDTDIHLTCSAQGSPAPTFTWFREINGRLQAVLDSSRFEPSQDILHIKRLKVEDSGRWICKASNTIGEQRLDIHLTVTAHLSAHVLPQLQVINSGDSAIFNCTVSGSPVGRIQWFRNGVTLPADINGKVKLLSPLVLAVSEVTRHDRGMYQCMVRNERESAQGSAELRLGDTVPELKYAFIEQAMRPGPHVSLRCSATGSPPPQISWLLDNEPMSGITAGHRYAISQYVDQEGDVISHLNISRVRVEDGGLYSCWALNSLGSARHSARLNIYGPPFIRSIGPVKAVAGVDVTLHCPYSGYPIESVRWERHGQEVLQDLRHRFDKGGALIISRLDPTTDSGFYACSVISREGETARREIQLIVNSPPIIEPFTFPLNLQEGKRAQVTCAVTSGDLPIHFAWKKDGAAIPTTLQVEERAAEFYTMLIFKQVTASHSGSYTCVASNSASRANHTAKLMVKVAPQWVIEPHNVSTLLGNPLLIKCSAKGFPDPQITWLKGQGKTKANYQPVLTLHASAIIMANGSMWLEAVSPQDEGHYLCRATNGIGSGLGKVIYVGVNEPARFDLPERNVTTRRGNSVALLCHVYGDTPIDIIWTLRGNRLDLSNRRYSASSRNTGNGVKSQIIIGKTDREDTGVYKCLAENAFGHSEHIINLVVQEKPDTPCKLKVIEVFSRSVKLQWEKPFDGNSPVIGFLVQYHSLISNLAVFDPARALNLTLPANLVSFKPPFEEAMLSGLKPATIYRIRILAVNFIDHSHFSDDTIIKTQEEEPGGAPREVRVQAVGSGELSLTWLPPSRESWHGVVLGYVITWKESEGFPNASKSTTVKGWLTNELQLTGLKKFTRYDITIRAFNSIGSGPASPSVIGTTKEGVPEAPPQNVACVEITSQLMKVSWSSPPLSFQGGHILGYKVYYRPISSDILDLPTIGDVKRTTSTDTYLHGLYKYTNYSIKVLAFTGPGDGVPSSPIYCKTDEDRPGPPASIKASALTDRSILVSWLSPTNPNGRIYLYTVYYREVGRVGTHISFNVHVEERVLVHLRYEVRNLREHKLYEFWVSATTTVGEGEPTAMIIQSTSSTTPARITSFSEVFYSANKAAVVLPCYAVGNPTPRTRWLHRDRAITFSELYRVMESGDLLIHKIDPSQAGNYTCDTKNLFGEDEITYNVIVVLAPNAPTLDVLFTTAMSIRVKWSHPEDGGALIQGYTLQTKHTTDDWTSTELSPDQSMHTLEGLRCGSLYYIYILAHNRVGKGSPSPILSASTKGGPPLLPQEKDFIETNASTLQLNLNNWPDGGCPISRFSLQYRQYKEKIWTPIPKSVSEKKIAVKNLTPATWYQLKISAKNDAGTARGLFKFGTTTLTGDRTAMPPDILDDIDSTEESLFYRDAYVIIPTIITLALLIFLSIFWIITYIRRRSDDEEVPQVNEIEHEPQPQHHHHHHNHRHREDKTTERDNRRNRLQVYIPSPIKPRDKLSDEASGAYEISPYATFSVPVPTTSRCVNSSTLDYTMQFKTFGHIEDEDHNAIMYPKSAAGKHTWHKNRYYINEAQNLQKTRLRQSRLAIRPESESDETSGSPCGEGPSGSGYRVPVKPIRGERQVVAGYTGYETLLVADLFRPGSSTESNDVSPPFAERRLTPRHVGGRRQQRPTSSSSSDEGEIFEMVTSNIRIQPPTGFSDNRDTDEDEFDREAELAKLPVELASILASHIFTLTSSRNLVATPLLDQVVPTQSSEQFPVKLSFTADIKNASKKGNILPSAFKLKQE